MENKRKTEFVYLGHTEDNKMIGAIGVWNFFQTNGLPIGIQVEKLWEMGVAISWIHEYNIALWKGLCGDKFLKLIEDELLFNKYYNKETVLEKLNSYIVQRELPTPFNFKMLEESKCIADGR